MISQDIFRRADECDAKNSSRQTSSLTLKTPDVLLEGDFVELPQEGTSSPLFMSFDMEDVTLHHSSSQTKLCIVDSYEDNVDSTVEQINSFVKMLASKSNTVKFEAASALLHVLSINHVDTVVECGALPALIQALVVHKEKVRDECIKCLDIIVKSATRFREQVLRDGGLICLLKCADEATGENSRANALRVISNIFSDEYQPNFELITSSIPYFIRMLGSDREPILIVECSKILSYLTNCYPDLHRLILDHGAKKLLQDLLSHEDESVVVSSIRLTRHLISPRGKREKTSTATAFGVHPHSSRSEQQGAKTCEKISDPHNHSHNYSHWGSGHFHYGMPSSVVTPLSDTITKLSPPTRFNETLGKQRNVPGQRKHWPSNQCRRSSCSAPGSLWKDKSSPPFVFSDVFARDCISKEPCPVNSSPSVPNKSLVGHHNAAQSPDIPQIVRLSRSFHGGEISDYKFQQNVSQKEVGVGSSPGENEVKHAAPIAIECKMNHDILLEKEKYLLSDYTVLVLEQLRPCRIQNKKCLPDSRYPFPLGFPGLECKHCAGTKEARRFFWSTAVRFKNNNGEFAKHLFKCTHCPDTVKEQMNFMKTYHTRQMKSLPRGNMSLVFRRVFNRLQVDKGGSA